MDTNKIKKNLKKNWQKYLEILTDISTTMVHLGKNPTKTGIASVGMKLVNSYARYANSTKEDGILRNPFQPKEGWVFYNIGLLTQTIVSHITQIYGYEILSADSDGGRKYCVSKLGEYPVGYFVNSEGYYSGIHLKREFRKETLEKISDSIWGTFPSKNILVSTEHDETSDQTIICIKEDEQEEILSSKASLAIYDRIMKFLNYGYNRSIILYGAPGTGKSMAIKNIVKNLNTRSIKISSSDDVIYTRSDVITTIVEILSPESLIIDDFDRIYKPDKILTELEKLNKKLKLFLVSVNDTNNFDKAVIRPGRFDDIIDFFHLDDEIHEKMIGKDVSNDIKERLKKLPIAYIFDFHKRKNVLGQEIAISEIENLERRAQMIRNNESSQSSEEDDDDDDYYDDDDDEDLYDGDPPVEQPEAV